MLDVGSDCLVALQWYRYSAARILVIDKEADLCPNAVRTDETVTF